MAREFSNLGIPGDRIQVSDYGFRPMTDVSGVETSPERPLRIGFVGTLVWHKGVHVLVEAVGGLRGEFEVVIHGDLNVFPDYVAALKRAALSAPLTFAGGFDRDRVEAVYGTFDVLVVPSLWPENSPLVIHEAFMRGIPVVGARTGGIPELVHDGRNGLLYEPFSAESLRSTLQRLIDDRLLVGLLSRHMPPVKTIHEDAQQWKARYQSVCSGTTEVVQA